MVLAETRRTPDSPAQLNDPYDLPALAKTLASNGYGFCYAPQTPSTMTLAEHLVRLGSVSLPSIVLTDHQTAGVGREGRVWHDKPGASVLLTAAFRLENEELLPVYADLIALRTCLVLQQIAGSGKVKLKWPNDLTFEDKKLGGILVTNVYTGNKYLSTNIGIGINVHYQDTELTTYPTDYGATALDVAADRQIERQRLLLLLMQGLRHTDTDAQAIASNRSLQASYNRQWQACSLLLDQQVSVIDGDTVVTRGPVVGTEIGKGIEIFGETGYERVTQWTPGMKVRKE